MIQGELIGLPAAGKSWVVENKVIDLKGDYKVISNGFDIFKLTNIILSIVPYVNLFAIYGKLYKSNQNKINLFSYVRRIAIMYERLGHLKRKHTGNLYIDEGPLQSVWAVFHNLPLDNINKQLAKKLIESVSVTNKVIFISVPKLTHQNRMLERTRNHRYIQAQEKYIER